MTGTYNGVKKHGMCLGNKDLKTHGGYSGSNTVHQKFVLKIPDGMDLEKTAPIMCAGITLYDPLKFYGYTERTGKTVGIIGIGGLGTMGLKIAKALGHNVVAISTSENKKQKAMEKGADVFIASKDPE
jgi:D-arabinose 1-dehydrogenase-like Zn-dependent alcohol dehydrogenase